ncbi:FAD dependent oxidoreductase [Xylariaceae sp. FL0255]|nr:FAD dependent oxidoreductase [Xylariaceae sp. FL0255]
MTVYELEPQKPRKQAELPTPSFTYSYWHRNPSKKLFGHRTTTELPNRTEIIVIGSGITGAFAANELVSGGKDVVMLEAREACWGATGRNGGHCQPAVWDNVPEAARFELATFDHVASLVKEHDIPCDFEVVGGIHAIYTQELLDLAKKQIEKLQRHPDLKDKSILITDRKELAARRIPEALGAVFQPKAAKCWPYKLVAWILESLLGKNEAASGKFNLQTNTPVVRLERDGGSEAPWVVHTSRGQIRARDVLLATNAYTSYLLAGATELITPVRGQVAALEPPNGAPQLPHTYVWSAGFNDQYLIHRGPEDSQVDAEAAHKGARSLVLGGERWATPEGEEGISRDDAINPLVSRALHHSLNHTIKLLPEGEPEDEELHASWEWTGIMGFSRDGDPWVGRVPMSLLGNHYTTETSSEGLWMCAGFSGHGMPRAPTCGIAIAEMILGKDCDEATVKVPKAWLPHEGRVKKARTMELPRSYVELIRMLPDV